MNNYEAPLRNEVGLHNFEKVAKDYFARGFMSFSILDLILILIIFGFVIYGFVMGLVEGIGALVGLVLGVYLAGRYYDDFGSGIWTQVIAFILIFGITSRLIGLVFYGINKVFRLLTIIPFLGSANRLAGALLGFVEGVLVVGVALIFISQFSLPSWMNHYLDASWVMGVFMAIAKLFKPLIPFAIG